jgi:hypothetical protein
LDSLIAPLKIGYLFERYKALNGKVQNDDTDLRQKRDAKHSALAPAYAYVTEEGTRFIFGGLVPLDHETQ